LLILFIYYKGNEGYSTKDFNIKKIKRQYFLSN
jgi:hypothetical protein